MPLPSRSIRASAEFQRVCALPRRTVTRADAEAWNAVLAPQLACKGAPVSFLRWQGLALAEAAQNDGAFLALPVGQGKTLVCELLPVVMQARRAVLLINATLEDKTYSDRRSLSGQWRIARPPARVITLTALSREQNANLLNDIAPDLIIIDEADDLANSGASVCKRVDRYRAKAHAEGRKVRIVVLTGTPTRGDLMDFWHLLIWALGEGAPAPLVEHEARDWAAAMSDGRDTRPGIGVMRKPKPGVLGDTPASASAWFQKRLCETPGVLMIDEDSAASVPLSVHVRLAPEDPILDEVFTEFLKHQVNPRGIPVSDPLSRWRLDTQLGGGLVSYWDPPPPARWAASRRAVAKHVRLTIARSHSLDTELQVLRAHADYDVVSEWQNVRHTYKESTKFEWISGSTLQGGLEWLAEDDRPSIIWCGIVEFGERLAELAGLPYYGSKGRAQCGRSLSAADPGRSLVASWNANKRGFNLQAWNRAAIFQPPGSSKFIEQLIGRNRRTGQKRGVEITVFATSGATLDTFDKMLAEAKRVKDRTGLTQQILKAKISYETPVRTRRNMYRWARRETDD